MSLWLSNSSPITHVSMQRYTYINICIEIDISYMYSDIYVWKGICMHACICIYICIFIYMDKCLYTHIKIYVPLTQHFNNSYQYVCIHIYRHTHSYVILKIYRHTHIHMHIEVWKDLTQRHTYAHTLCAWVCKREMYFFFWREMYSFFFFFERCILNPWSLSPINFCRLFMQGCQKYSL